MTTPLTPHAWQLDVGQDFDRLGGVFVGLDPGSGKTYAAAEIARRGGRVLFVCPASAMPQTRAQFESYGLPTFPATQLEADRHHGASSGAVVFASYTWLTRDAQHDFLDRFAPDAVILDEYHQARGLGNSARKRLERYLHAHPAVRCAVFTGSPGGFEDLAYGLQWALRSHVRHLIPRTDYGVEAMAAALAADPALQAQFREELLACPGVYFDVGDVGQYGGEVALRVIHREPALVLPASWELPDGFLVESAAHAAVLAKQLAWGFWPSVEPRPSEAFLEARRQWAARVARAVQNGLADTEFQVRAVYPEAYAHFRAAELAEGPLAEPVAVWGDTRELEYFSTFDQDTAESTRQHPTIIWAHSIALQRAVSERLGCPWHHARGLDADGVRLDETRAPLVVASISACYQSFNAQHFSHSVVLEPPADPEVWKQLVGRTARQGQAAPRVTVDIVVNCAGAAFSLQQALDGARVLRQSTGKSNPLLLLTEQDLEPT